MYNTTLDYSTSTNNVDAFAKDHLRLDALRGTHIDLYQDIPPVAATRQEEIERISTISSELTNLGELLRYHRYQGTDRDRAAASVWLEKLIGEKPTTDRIAVTHGTQDAMIMLLSHYLGGGGTLLTEQLTYPSVKSIARLMRVPLQGVEMDGDGVLPDALEAVVRSTPGPHLLYLMPNVHNPTTITMPEGRRNEVVAVARRLGVVIVEDDAFGHFSPHHVRPIASLAPDITWHIFTLAKALSVQFRIAYVTGPSASQIQTVFGPTRRMTHWMATPLAAELATSVVESGIGERLLAGVCEAIAERQQLVADCFSGLSYDTQPHSPHVWLQVPEQWDPTEFVEQVRERGTLVMGSAPCFTKDTAGPRRVRVCLGVPTHEQVEAGLRTIAAVARTLPGGR